jgi:hypothetical protein
MTPIVIHPIIFYLFIFTAFLLLVGCVVLAWLYFSKWFKDVAIFTDAQGRWDLKYIDATGVDEIEYNDGTYITKGATPPLNKSGKALFKFSVGNPKPESLTFQKSGEIDSKTISSVINNKLVQILMSLQSSFVTLQYIMLVCTVVSAIASVLTALKMFGIIK